MQGTTTEIVMDMVDNVKEAYGDLYDWIVYCDAYYGSWNLAQVYYLFACLLIWAYI